MSNSRLRVRTKNKYDAVNHEAGSQYTENTPRIESSQVAAEQKPGEIVSGKSSYDITDRRKQDQLVRIPAVVKKDRYVR